MEKIKRRNRSRLTHLEEKEIISKTMEKIHIITNLIAGLFFIVILFMPSFDIIKVDYGIYFPVIFTLYSLFVINVIEPLIDFYLYITLEIRKKIKLEKHYKTYRIQLTISKMHTIFIVSILGAFGFFYLISIYN